MRLATELFDFWPISTPTVGTVTEDSTAPRSGKGAGVFPSGAFNIIEPLITAVTGRTFYYRFAVRLDALPSATTAPLRLIDTTGTVIEVSITTAGVLRIFNQIETKLLTGTETITPGQWNVVEIKLNIPASGKGKVSWRFNGVDKVVDQEMEFRNIGISRARFGNPGGVSSGAVTGIDDVAINDDQGAKDNSWIGTAADPIPELLPRYWGAFIAENSEATIGIEKAPYDLADVLWDDFEADAGRSVGILHLGDPWTEANGPEWDGYFFGGRTSDYVHERGAILMKDLGGPSGVIQLINEGHAPTLAGIKRWAEAARDYGHPFFLRLWWEMNGNWFNWGRVQCTGAEYVEAWRRLHGIVHPIAPNCTFVWCPNAIFEGHVDPFGDAEEGFESMYPGHDYVDWTGMDGYTGQNPHKKLGWRTSKAVFGETYERLQEEAGDKPVMVCETGASEYKGAEPSPPAKAEWIKQFLQWTLPYEMPNIRAILWFNWYIEEGGGRIDWPIETSPSATEAFAESIGEPHFVDPSVGGFTALRAVPLPGELLPPPLDPPAEDNSNLWELLYAAMGFHIEDDEANEFALRRFCEGLCNPLQPAYSLARERDERKGWAVLFDPAECPEEALPYLAQYVGVEPTPEMSTDQLRAEIAAPTGWRRGEPEPIRTTVRRTLTGAEPLVIIRPRTPEPGHHYIRTLLSQTPDPERTEALVRAAVPAWEALDYEAFVGMTYADSTAKYSTYALRTAAYPAYRDATEETP